MQKNMNRKVNYVLKGPTSKARMSNIILKNGTTIQPIDKTVHERALLKAAQAYKGTTYGKRKAKT